MKLIVVIAIRLLAIFAQTWRRFWQIFALTGKGLFSNLL